MVKDDSAGESLILPVLELIGLDIAGFGNDSK
jgi:hypothetical protein